MQVDLPHAGLPVGGSSRLRIQNKLVDGALARGEASARRKGARDVRRVERILRADVADDHITGLNLLVVFAVMQDRRKDAAADDGWEAGPLRTVAREGGFENRLHLVLVHARLEIAPDIAHR